jgi:hypothetical protein
VWRKVSGAQSILCYVSNSQDVNGVIMNCKNRAMCRPSTHPKQTVAEFKGKLVVFGRQRMTVWRMPQIVDLIVNAIHPLHGLQDRVALSPPFRKSSNVSMCFRNHY